MFPSVPCPHLPSTTYHPIRRWLWGAIHLVAMLVSTIASFFSLLTLVCLRTSLEGKHLHPDRGTTLAVVEWGLLVQQWDPSQREVSAPKGLHIHHIQIAHHSSFPCNEVFLAPPCPQMHFPIRCPWYSFTQHFSWCPSELCGVIPRSLVPALPSTAVQAGCLQGWRSSCQLQGGCFSIVFLSHKRLLKQITATHEKEQRMAWLEAACAKRCDF